MSCILAHSLKVAVIHWFDGVGVIFSRGTTSESSLKDEQDILHLKVHHFLPQGKILSCSTEQFSGHSRNVIFKRPNAKG
jgi:hypothetical protein